VKILIAVHHFSPHLSGVGNVAEQQAKHLAMNGEEVTVLTSDCSDKAGLSIRDGYKISRIRALNFTETKFSAPFPIFSPSLIWHSYKLVKHTDIVHVHDAFYMSSLVTSFWAKVLKKPLFMTQHIEMIPHPSTLIMQAQRFAYGTGGAYIFRNCNKIFVYNERVKAFLINKNVHEEKIVTIVNGVDIKLFHPSTPKEKYILRKKFNLPKDALLVLFVGRYVPKKGFSKLLKCVSENYVIVFVGGKNNLKSPPQNTVFLGLLQQNDLSEIYRACDIFVLPSEGEGFPLSIQEAMASGLPIIAGYDSGYDSYKFDGNMLRLINPSIEVIKDNLSEIAENHTLRKVMSRYSLRYAKKHFNWPAVILNITNLYIKELS
jgi:D-inositol-3-phosphate glycosyltransferase